MRAYLACIAFALTACGTPTPPVPFPGPNGGPAYSIRCGGLGDSLARCYRRAAELCPAGYTVIDRSQDIDKGTTGWQRLIVECKP